MFKRFLLQYFFDLSVLYTFKSEMKNSDTITLIIRKYLELLIHENEPSDIKLNFTIRNRK